MAIYASVLTMMLHYYYSLCFPLKNEYVDANCFIGLLCVFFLWNFIAKFLCDGLSETIAIANEFHIRNRNGILNFIQIAASIVLFSMIRPTKLNHILNIILGEIFDSEDKVVVYGMK